MPGCRAGDERAGSRPPEQPRCGEAGKAGQCGNDLKPPDPADLYARARPVDSATNHPYSAGRRVREGAEPSAHSRCVVDACLPAAVLARTLRGWTSRRVSATGGPPQPTKLGHVLGTEGRRQPPSAGTSRTCHRRLPRLADHASDSNPAGQDRNEHVNPWLGYHAASLPPV